MNPMQMPTLKRLLRLLILALVLACAPQSMGQPSQGQPFRWDGAGGQTVTTVNGRSFIPTIWVVGDPHLVASALRGVARVIHPTGGDGGSTLLMPAVRLGLLISLFFACVAYFTKGKIAWASWLGMTLVAYMLFINTSSVMVQTYFSYSGAQLAAGGIGGSGVAGGQYGSGVGGVGVSAAGGAGSFEIVDDVPLGFAIPAAVAGAISTGLADLFSTSFSTVNSNGNSGTQFADPLKQLLALRSSNPCLNTQVCSSIFSFTRYCLNGTFTTGGITSTQAADLSAVATSPDALKAILITSQLNGSLGTTRYFSPIANQNNRLGQLMSCQDAGVKIYDDVQAYPTNTAALIGAGGNSPTVSVAEIGSSQNSALTDAPAVLALQNLMGQTATLAATNVVNLVMWKAVEAGLIASNKPFDQAQFTATTIVTEAMERWRVDGAAEGSVFLRGMFTSMNVLLFVLICLTPMVFLIGITMLSEGGTIIKEYILTIVWTQTWFPTAVVINYYITESTASKLQSFSLSNVNLMFAPVNHVKLYEELGTAIASAGWMMGMVPLLSYALLRGSTQGLVSLATKAGAGGAQYADETTAVPSVAKASGGDLMQTSAAARGIGPMASGGGSTLQGPGGGIITSGASTAATQSSALSASTKASVADAALIQAALQYGNEVNNSAALAAQSGSTTAGSTGITTEQGRGTSAETSNRNVSSNVISTATKAMLGAGISGRDVGALVAAGGAAYAATLTAGGGKAAAATSFMGVAKDQIAKMGLSGKGAAIAMGAAGAIAMAFDGTKASTEWAKSDANNAVNEMTNSRTSGTSLKNTNSAGLTKTASGGTSGTLTQSAAEKVASSNLEAATKTWTNANENARIASTAAANTQTNGGTASITPDEVTNAGKTAGQSGQAPSNSLTRTLATAAGNGHISPEQAQTYDDNFKKAQIAAANSGKYGGETGNNKTLATGNAALGAIAIGSADPIERALATAALADVSANAGWDRPVSEAIRSNALGAVTAASAAARGGAQAALTVDAGGTVVTPTPPTTVDPAVAASIAAGTAKTNAAGTAVATAVDKGIAVAAAAAAATYSGEAGKLNAPPPSLPPNTQPGKLEGQGAPEQSPPPASDLTPLARTTASEFDQAKARNNGLTPATAGLVASIVAQRDDLSKPVANAIARSRDGSTVDRQGLSSRILQSSGNLAALSAANIPAIGDVSKLPTQTQGELAVFMDRLGRDKSISLLQGTMSQQTGSTELNKLVGNSEVSAKLVSRYKGDSLRALLAYSSASAVARAAGGAPPLIEGRTPTSLETEITSFMDRTLSPMTAVGGLGWGVLINEASYWGGAAITGGAGLASRLQTDSSIPPPLNPASWVSPKASSPAPFKPVAKLPASAEAAVIRIASNTESLNRGLSPDGLRRLLGTESGGNAAIKNLQGSSATGLGQFIDATWLDQATRPNTPVNRVAVAKGLVEATPQGLRIADDKKSDLLALRYDAALMVDATASYAQQNLATLSKANLEGIGDVSKLTPQQRDAYAYVMHLLGPGNGIRYLSGGNNALSETESRNLLNQQVGVANASRYIELAGGASPALQQFTDRLAKKVAGLPSS